MSKRKKAEGVDFKHDPYEQEARQRWGDEAVDTSKERLTGKHDEAQRVMTEIYTRLAEVRHEAPDSEVAQAAIKEWFVCLNTYFGDYSLEAFKGLGQLYVADERFTHNIDRYGEGLAAFMCEAMAVYADTRTL